MKTPFTPMVRLTHSRALNHRPSVAVAGNEVYIVWWSDRSGNNEVYYTRSTDGGETWSADAQLTNTGRDAQYPHVAISRNFIHVVWLDARDGSPQVYYQRKQRN